MVWFGLVLKNQTDLIQVVFKKDIKKHLIIFNVLYFLGLVYDF